MTWHLLARPSLQVLLASRWMVWVLGFEILGQWWARTAVVSMLFLLLAGLTVCAATAQEVWRRGVLQSYRWYLIALPVIFFPMLDTIGWLRTLGVTIPLPVESVLMAAISACLLAFSAQEMKRQERLANLPGLTYDGFAMGCALAVVVVLISAPEWQDLVARGGGRAALLLCFLTTVMFCVACNVLLLVATFRALGPEVLVLGGASGGLVSAFMLRVLQVGQPEAQALILGKWAAVLMVVSGVSAFCFLRLPVAQPVRSTHPQRVRGTAKVNRSSVLAAVLLVLALPIAWMIHQMRGISVPVSWWVVASSVCTATTIWRLLPLLHKALQWQQEFSYAAMHDPTSGLLNRRALQALETYLTTLEDSAHLVAFCIDLDDFRSINDLYGQPMGDRLLHAVGQVLSERAQTWAESQNGEVHVLRTGGDEFLVLLLVRGARVLPVTRQVMLTQLRNDLTRWWTLGDGARVFAKASVGMDHGPAPRVTDTLRQADLAMYRTKVHHVPLRSVERPGALMLRQQVRQWVRAALQEPVMPLDLQPIVDLRTRQVVSLEVLSRFRHPDRPAERLHPHEFLDVVGGDGLHAQMFELMVHTLSKHGLAHLPEPVPLALNVDPCLLMAPYGGEWLHGCLGLFGFEARGVTLEFSERLQIDLPGVREELLWLAQEGYEIAMDDFGAGYSNLTTLGELPLSQLKIDASVLNTAAHGDDSVLATIQSLGQQRGLLLVAKGVATPRHLAAAQRLGIARAQGFLLSHPMPIATVAAKLLAGEPITVNYVGDPSNDAPQIKSLAY